VQITSPSPGDESRFFNLFFLNCEGNINPVSRHLFQRSFVKANISDNKNCSGSLNCRRRCDAGDEINGGHETSANSQNYVSSDVAFS
jgi:hypothetical protein